MDEHIPSTTLELGVSGPNIDPGPLAGVVAGGPTLLVFLRHFG